MTAIQEQTETVRAIGPSPAEEIREVLGVKLDWKLRSTDTGGHYCVIEIEVPQGAGIPLHSHEAQEAFYVLEGRAEFARMGAQGPEWVPIEKGMMAQIPSYALHGFRNESGSAARLLITCTAGLEPFFREAATPVTGHPPAIEEIQRVLGIAEKHGQRFLPPSH